ncbi:UNVERIFIED_CONTAM: hypothetical protein PYX00_002536 [Menopon gallinae]|uniref:Peptidase S1 domain-containing protein n=1 Tax=Menopon gallinae TaxID=328185 RepID=A0AAW2IIP5_9NEOP
MGLKGSLVAALALFAFAEAQYGPLKGSSSGRTTTPFPPGFHSDNEIYNSDSNQVGSGGYALSTGQKSPAGAASFSDNPWLQGVVAQNSGPGPSYQQARPTQPCNVPGHVCVPRHQCQGGQTTSPGSGHRECDTSSEVCCQYGQQQPQPGPSYQPSQQPAHQPGPTYQPSPQPGHRPTPTYQPSQQPAHQPAPSYQPSQQPAHQPGPAYQPSPQPAHRPTPTFQPSQQPAHQPGPSYQQPSQPGLRPGPTFQAGQRPGLPSQGPNYYPGSQAVRPGQQPAHLPGPTYQQGSSQGQNYYPGSQPYRPGTNGQPIGGSIYDTGAAHQGSSYVTPAYGPYTGPLNTTPHPGCPAALKCVDEIYCDANGVMRDTVQVPIPGQDRVPLSECQNIETGIIGKCCRDPNYKDPWPDMNTHDHGHHDDGHFHQQGTSSDACGSSATCTPQSECSGDRQVQPGKHCQVPLDGSTGVCCSKPPFPSFSNNQQAVTPATTTRRPTPAQQYYTPKPSYANNPFLQGSLFSGQSHSQNLPNAIPGQQKDYDQSTSKPFGPGYPTPRPTDSHPSSTPAVQVSGGTPANLPVFPQIATSNSVYTPRPGQPHQQPSGSTVYTPRPSQPQQPSGSSVYTPRPGQPHQQPSSNSVYTPQPSQPQQPSSNSVYTPQPSQPQQPSGSSVYTPRPGQPHQQPSSNSVYTPQPSQPHQQPSGSSIHTPRPGQPHQQPSGSSVYTPRPTQPHQQPSSTSAYTPRPSQPHQQPSRNSAALPGSNAQNYFGTTAAPPVESNDIALPAAQTPSRVAPTKGVGPPGGYPFLAPTTEPSQRKPASGECGVRRDVQRPNGPNGLETGFGEFPWQVQVLAVASQTPLCSGAILSARVIVTAAHCVDDFRSAELSVKAGDWKLGGDAPDEPKPAQTRQVTAIARHPNYDPVSRFYDMAALILSEPLQIDEHVNTLCLGENGSPGEKPAGNNCVVTGWGKASLQSNSPGGTMHSISVSFIVNEQCEDTFRKTNLGKYFRLNKSFICAVPENPNDDLCQVDVGSPIACQKPNGRYELAGIYSWDVGCHQPVAASKVDKPWVQSVMNKPVEQIKQEEQAELQKKENLGFNPENSDSNKPGFSQGYGKK